MNSVLFPRKMENGAVAPLHHCPCSPCLIEMRDLLQVHVDLVSGVLICVSRGTSSIAYNRYLSTHWGYTLHIDQAYIYPDSTISFCLLGSTSSNFI